MAAFKQANATFQATISTEHTSISDVSCDVYLPNKVTGSIELRLHLTQEQSKILLEDTEGFVYFSVHSEERHPQGLVNAISSTEVLREQIINSSQNSHFNLLIGRPLNLRIVEQLPESPLDAAVSFWITPNLFLSQMIRHRTLHQIRDVAFEQYHGELTPDDKTKFTLSHRKRSYKNDEDDTVSFSELEATIEVANLSLDGPEIEKPLGQLDDLLLLTSFASRRLTACMGWEIAGSYFRVRQYLRKRATPDKVDLERPNSPTVIDFGRDFEDFLADAYPVFAAYANKDALRRAMLWVLLVYRSTIDGGFIQLFAALEMLILQDRKTNESEFILTRDEFKALRRRLVKMFQRVTVPNDKTAVERPLADKERRLIEDKLSGLNRPAFKRAFRDFCKHPDHRVYLDDLWPVASGNDREVTLYQVRNWLVHGEHLNEEQTGAINFARQHLQWTVERMILAILRWPLDRSAISPDKIVGTGLVGTWQEKQKSFQV